MHCITPGVLLVLKLRFFANSTGHLAGHEDPVETAVNKRKHLHGMLCCRRCRALALKSYQLGDFAHRYTVFLWASHQLRVSYFRASANRLGRHADANLIASLRLVNARRHGEQHS